MVISGFEEEPHPNLLRLNEEAARLSEANASELRKDAISLIYDAFSGLLAVEEELAKQGSKRQAVTKKFLELDFLASPGLRVDEFVDTLTYTLVRTKPRVPGDNFGADRIHVYMPVPRDFHKEEGPSALPELSDVQEIYVLFEKEKSDGVHTQRYAISRKGVYEYAVLNDPDYKAEAGDILDREVHLFATDTLRLHNLMVAQLIEDHKNFTLLDHSQQVSAN